MTLTPNTVYTGDCLDVMRGWPAVVNFDLACKWCRDCDGLACPKKKELLCA